MTSYARQQELIRQLQNSPNLSVNDLGELLSVSPITIRRDLSKLEQEGIVVRTHGGAVVANKTPVAPALQRADINSEGKSKIADAASKLIHNGNSIILDAGSTVGAFARRLVNFEDITVITPSLYSALELSGAALTILMPGGILLPEELMLIGPECEAYFKNVKADFAFIGTTGVRPGKGLTIVSPFQYSIKRTMLASAQKTVALVDYTKFSKNGLNLVAYFSEIDYLITDREITDGATADCLAECGVEIIYAL